MEAHKEPNLIDKAKSLGTAVYDWASKDKFQKTPHDEVEKRKAICLACPQWDATAFNNLGKCKICGCSSGKWYIPSSKCPDNPPKWNSIASVDEQGNSIHLEKKPSLIVTRSQPSGSNS